MTRPLVVAAPLLFAATSHAQVQGEVDDISPPSMSPILAATAKTPVERLRRWSLGLNVGSMQLVPHHHDGKATEFTVTQLAVRFRATRHLELELACGGGNELIDRSELVDNPNFGEWGAGHAVIALRYRFRPESRWNGWLIGGVGGTDITRYDHSGEVAEGGWHSTVHYGVGIERRFRRLALQAELRGLNVAPADTAMDAATSSAGGDDSMWYRDWSGHGWVGGQLTIGASYYL